MCSFYIVDQTPSHSYQELRKCGDYPSQNHENKTHNFTLPRISNGLYSHPRQNCLNINYHKATVLSQSVLCNPTKQLTYTSQSPAATFLNKLCSPENREGFIHPVIEKTGKKNEKGGKGEEKGRAGIAREICKFAQLAVYPKFQLINSQV